MKSSSFLATVAVILWATLPAEISAQQVKPSGCRPNVTSPATSPYRWSPSSDIHVLVSPGQFKAREVRAFGNALSTWQRELARLEIKIRLIEPVERLPQAGENNYILITRSDSLPQGRQAQFTSLGGVDGYFTAAEISLKAEVRKTDEINRLLQHELGHAFGLTDCPSCDAGTTVMNLGKSSIRVWPAGLFGGTSHVLTACDARAVAEGYRNQPSFGMIIPVNQIIGDDLATEVVVTKQDYDTSAPEMGEGKSLIEAAQVMAPEPTAPEAALVSQLLSQEAANSQILKNYTFKRDVVIETVGTNGSVTGTYHRLSQISFADDGECIERIIAFPKPSLKRLIITNEDVSDLGSIQLAGLESAKSDRYRIVPAGRDGRMLIFRVLPRDLRQAKIDHDRVFYGTLWVDERTMKIVKVNGRALPEGNQRFPLFKTKRNQIAENIYGPVNTLADEMLDFPSGKIRMRVAVRYFDYQLFRSNVTITEVDQ